MIKNNFFLKITSFLVISIVFFVGFIVFSSVTYAGSGCSCQNSCTPSCPKVNGADCTNCNFNTASCPGQWETDNGVVESDGTDCHCNIDCGGGPGPTPTPRPCGDCIPAGCGITAMFIDESKKFAENSCKLNEVSLTENQENPASLSVAEPKKNNVVADETFTSIIDKSSKTSPLASLQVLIDQIMQKTFSILKIFTKFFSKLNIS